jgi:site-specific recombinase XerD
MSKQKNDIELHESVISFLNYLKSKNKSKGTIEGYECDIQMFFNFMTTYKKKRKVTNALIKSITIKDLYAFMSYLEEEVKNKEGKLQSRNSPASRARKVATLKSYFKYLYRIEKLITNNIAEDLDTPTLEKKKPIALNLNQSEQLLDSLNNYWDRDKIKNKCIITLFLHCGLRISEVCNIKINDIKDGILTVFGKGQKERYIYLDEECIKTINDYLKDRKDEKANEDDKKYLFLNRLQKKSQTQAVRIMIEKYLEFAELTDKKYTPHKLRSTYASLMNKAGANIRQIQVAKDTII